MCVARSLCSSSVLGQFFCTRSRIETRHWCYRKCEVVLFFCIFCYAYSFCKFEIMEDCLCPLNQMYILRLEGFCFLFGWQRIIPNLCIHVAKNGSRRVNPSPVLLWCVLEKQQTLIGLWLINQISAFNCSNRRLRHKARTRVASLARRRRGWVRGRGNYSATEIVFDVCISWLWLSHWAVIASYRG